MHANFSAEPAPTDLNSFIKEINERLEQESMSNANRAFNLGCMIGLVPAGLIVILAYILTKGSWIPVGITAVLMFIALMLFTNLAAYTARNRTMDRIYHEQIAPQIEEKIQELGIDQEIFNRTADEELPAGASLRKYLDIETIDSDSQNDNGEPNKD